MIGPNGLLMAHLAETYADDAANREEPEQAPDARHETETVILDFEKLKNVLA